MDKHDATPLPAMSYITIEPKPMRPTEAQIKRRAHHIWVMREGAPGNAALDWLQAECELTSELGKAAARPVQFIESRGLPASAVASRSPMPETSEHPSRLEVECKPQPEDVHAMCSESRVNLPHPAKARHAA